MKILFCGEFPRSNNFGGSHTVNVEILKYLVASGAEVRAFSPLFKGDSTESIQQNEGLPITFLPTRYLRKKAFADLLVMWDFNRQIRRFLEKGDFKPDIIHIDANPALCLDLEGYERFLFLHGSGGRAPEITRWFRHTYSAVVDTVEKHYERKAISAVNRVFINSLHSKEALIRDHHLPEEERAKVLVLKLGFNLDRLAMEKTDRAAAREEVFEKYGIENLDTKVLIFVGAISLNKDQAELIQTLEQVLKTHSETVLFMVGKPGNNFEGCQELIRHLGLEKRAFLTHAITDQELGKILLAADVYTSASVEGFGINQVEGMAADLPLVAWDKQAVKELFEEGRQGFLVHNREMMVDAVKRLLSDDQLRETMGRAAKEHAHATYSWEKMGAIILSHFEEVTYDD
jgi:glycosyltransferase involved in cell wall biosynthesis